LTAPLNYETIGSQLRDYPERNMRYTLADLNEKCDVDTSGVYGVYRWKSSGNVVPNNILEEAGFSPAALKANRDAWKIQSTEILRGYAEAQKNRTPEQIAEERFEARAAMGPGVDMVNILTGEKWTT